MHQDCFKMFKFLVLVFLVCKIRVPQCPTHNSYDSYIRMVTLHRSEAAAASSNLGGRCSVVDASNGCPQCVEARNQPMECGMIVKHSLT